MSPLHAQRRWAALTLAGAVALAGCASTDPAPDITQAANSVADRSASTPDWTARWDGAAAWNGTTPLTADAAVAVALVRNRELRGALTEIAMARAELAAAQTPPNPVVSFLYGAPTDGGPGSMITASVMIELAWLWRRPSEVAAAEATLRATTLRAADRALATIADVRVLHATIVAAESEAAFASDADDALRMRANLIAERHAAGLVPASELRMAEEKAREAHREHIVAHEELHHAKIAMLELLAISDASVEWTTDGVWPTAPTIDDPESLAMDAPSRRLDVAALAADALAADHAARRAGLERLPAVDLGAMFERSMEGSETLGPQVSVTVPIFDRGDVSVAKAAARREAALLAFDAASHAARSEARMAAFSWLSARNAWREGSDERRSIAERELAAMREARAAGAVDRVAELEAVAMLAERSMLAVRDRVKAVQSAIRLERSVGGWPPSVRITAAKGANP